MVELIVGDRMKVGHSFSANIARINILMRIQSRINTIFAQFVHQKFNLIEIGVVVYAWSNFDGLPDDAQSDVVEPP